jgi:hypothetical protein
MKKHHKKPSAEQQMKLQTAQNRNDFFKRLEKLVNLIAGDKETYKSMSQKTLENIYACRIRSPRIEAAEGCSISPQILEEFREFTMPLLRTSKAVFNDNGDTITFYDYLTVGLSLFLLVDTIRDLFEKTNPNFVQKIAAVLAKIDEPNSVAHQAKNIAASLAIYLSDLKAEMYSVNMDFVEAKNSSIPTLHTSFKISVHQQKKEDLLIDGIHRPSVRLGWVFQTNVMDWCMLPPELFGLPKRDDSQGLSVFIQFHALQRIIERMDCLDPNFFGIFVYWSLKNPKILPGQNGKFLIEFLFHEKIVGYFVASVHSDKIVLRTFLFLTNNGTPEGQKLAELTGIQKQDKKYLALDKLSTFMDPELRQNETIRRLFVEAGCGALFELTKTGMMDDEFINSNVKAETLMRYLKLNPVDASEPPDFSDAFKNARYENLY